MNSAQFIELLLQSLEHERGGVKVYTTALKCAQRPDLQAEWEKYLSQTEEHVSTLTELCEVFDIDPFTMTPGTQIVKALGTSLVEAMNTALAAGDPTAAQLVATECVVLAETKDHLNWELLGEAAKTLSGEEREALQEAYEKIEEQEDEHLYHTQGWCRELWLESLGLEAELPPPEERQDVTSAAEAQQAKESRVPRH
jgi:ferritin-like metal-binding protein YciE